MKKFVFFILILTGTLVFSCSKNNETKQEEQQEQPQKLLSTLPSGKQGFSFKLPTTGSAIPAEVYLETNFEKKIAKGVLNHDGNSSNFVIEIAPNHLEQATFEKISENAYRVHDGLMKKTFLVERISKSEGSERFKTIIDGKEVEFEARTNALELRCVPCVVGVMVVGVSLLVSTVSCWHQANIQEGNCRSVYAACTSSCSGSCSYFFSSTACGGTCRVECNYH